MFGNFGGLLYGAARFVVKFLCARNFFRALFCCHTSVILLTFAVCAAIIKSYKKSRN